MPQRSLIASLAIACLVFGASCFNEAKAPSIVPTRTLGLAPDAVPEAKAGPVSVAFASSSPVGVVFDRAMRGAEAADALGAKLTALGAGAQPVGVFRWVGKSALLFSPRSPLALATDYEVSVPAGALAIDGSMLAAPYAFRFSTDRPAVVSLEPREGQISLNPTFTVRFSQPVSPESVGQAAHLFVGEDEARRPLPLGVIRTKSDGDTRVQLTTPLGLPPDTRVELSFDESLHGLEGPLPSGKVERFTMRTYGALAVVSAQRTPSRASGKCGAGGVELELSNPVTVRELEAHVRFEPPVPIAWNREHDDALTKVDLRATLSPARKYELVVRAGMKDVYGQALTRTTSRTLETAKEPWLHIGEQEVFAVEGPRAAARVGVEAANLAVYDLLAQPLNEVSLARYLAEATPGAPDPLAEASRLFPQAKIEAVHVSSPFGPPETRSVSLDTLLASERRRGAALVVAETEGPTRAGTQLRAVRVVTQTDLRMTARMGVHGGVVWVDRLSNGKPVPGAKVAVRDATGREIVAGEADESGMATLSLDAHSFLGDAGTVDPRSILVARSGDDWTFRPLADDVEGACGQPPLGAAILTGALVTDRGSYELGDTIWAKAFFREEPRRGEAAPAAGRPVRLTVTGARGDVVSTTVGKLDSYGGFSAQVHVPVAERSGPWLLRAEVLLDADPAAPSAELGTAATASVRVVAPASLGLDVAPGAVPSRRRAPAEVVTTSAVRERGGLVVLAADKALYEVGQTATVVIQSPFREADAFVAVEGTGAPHGERAHVVGSTATLRLPITEAMAPMAHVSVVLSRSGSPGDDTPSMAVGQLGIRVAAPSRRLRVGVVAATPSYVQGDLLEADVVVTDPLGAPVRASVTFAAVDDAALPADPLGVFDAPGPVGSYWVDSRADMGRAIFFARGADPASPRAEAGVPPGAVSERAGQTAFFDPALLTDVTGRAHVRFKVPEGSTSLRLWALAATEDSRFGAGEVTADTSPALGVEVVAPKIVRAGDGFDVLATISSRGAPSAAEVTIAAIGVDIGAAVPQHVTVPAGGRVDTRWPVRTTDVGRAQIVFTARAGEHLTETTLALDVLDPSELESVVFYGEASDAAADHLGDWANIRSDDGSLDLKVSASPLVGLDDGLEQILKYPYEDTEQHATRLVALEALPDLLKEFRVVLPPDVGLVVDREVGALLEAQQDDGSFAAFSGVTDSRDGAPWRSTYALWALNAAATHDHKVPESATRRAIAFVKESLATWDRTPRERAEAAFALDVLTDLGVGDSEKMEAVFQARGHIPLFARALLAHAMTVQQMAESEADDLLGDVESHLRTTATGSIVVDEGGPEYGPLHDSSARATAMVLRALVARAKARAPNVVKKVRPKDLVARLARGLLSLRKDGAWRTPEETIWALRALEDYRAAHVPNHPDADALFYLNGVELLKLPLHEAETWQATATFGMRKVIGAAAPGGTLGFRVHGDGTLHYEARLRYARAGLLVPEDRGFALEKRIESLRRGSEPGAPDAVRSGDRVLVDLLVVTASPRDHVVIDDPLPGGLVALAEGPASGEPSRAFAPHMELEDDRVVWVIDHLPRGMSSLRYVARAMSAGRYVVPATRATCLYEPEAFGRTATSVLSVSR